MNIPQATDYIFINALVRAAELKVPKDSSLEDVLEIIFSRNKMYKVPDYYYMIVHKLRYPCLANFCDTNFKKTELYDLLDSRPDNYFLLMDQFQSGKESLYLAFNYNYIETNKIDNKNLFYITYKSDNKIKQIVSLNSLRLN